MIPITTMLFSLTSVYSLVYVKNTHVHPLPCLPCSEEEPEQESVGNKILNEREYEGISSSFFTEVDAKVDNCITEQKNNNEEYDLFGCEYDAYEEIVSTHKKYEQMFHDFYDDDYYKI